MAEFQAKKSQLSRWLELAGMNQEASAAISASWAINETSAFC
jgi:hypothetical protein